MSRPTHARADGSHVRLVRLIQATAPPVRLVRLIQATAPRVRLVRLIQAMGGSPRIHLIRLIQAMADSPRIHLIRLIKPVAAGRAKLTSALSGTGTGRGPRGGLARPVRTGVAG
ncbi:hypothetical protein HDA41_000336 [Streptomyces caelestis]|uniref:Uncharacterized protein n=1 Tax=Streptomyces caelestis TaxID=36816 RepID=A0A7W9LQK6_9ACTN|nr:hypothetical protein [Streptomyces caelestis]